MLRTFHANWAFVVVALNLAAGLTGLLWVRRHLPAPKWFWPLLYAGHGALALQVLAGVVLTRGLEEQPAFHLFYGFVVTIAAALAWSFRSQDLKRTTTIFSAVSLFVGAVSIRAMLTAGR